jgi:hypothetical protein
VTGSDPQKADGSNLNRLVGATLADVIYEDAEHRTSKAAIAERIMKGIDPHTPARFFEKPWQELTSELRRSAVLFGNVDSYGERDQLERFARRFGIVYIDIGMDVHTVGDHYCITGQVIVSIPGGPCMRCLGFITEENLAREAARYGDAGFAPQVIWANGVLASTAVGQFVQLVTPWHPTHQISTYLEYDGNSGTVSTSNRLKLVQHRACPHFPGDEVGDPFFGRN